MVSAIGPGTLRFQWRFNGTNLVGSTRSSLTLTKLQLANAGSYSVVVSNSFGWVASSAAILTVNQIPVARCTNVIASAGTNCMANASVDNGSFDPDGDAITINRSPPGPYPIGTNLVT